MLVTVVRRIPAPPKFTTGPGRRIPDRAKSWFYDAVKAGLNPYKAGLEMGISRQSVRRLMDDGQIRFREAHQPKNSRFIDPTITTVHEAPIPPKISKAMRQRKDQPADDLIFDYEAKTWDDVDDPVLKRDDLPSDRSVQAWDSFGYFRQRYFQRRNIPWQIEVAQIIMAWLEEAQLAEERVLGNLTVPPGGGKTTTVTHDLPAWVIARNRNSRVALGSRATGQSEKYTRRLRTTFEKNLLLNLDFGRFKPDPTEMWRVDEFIVDGVTGHAASTAYRLTLAGFDPEEPRVRRAMKDLSNPIHQLLADLEEVFMAGEKEPTVKALSQEMGFLGGRYDLNIWDDLCDRHNSKTPELRDSLAEWWDAEAVTRCEPGGIVALVGTRFGRYDLFRRNRDLVYTSEEAEEQLIATAWSGMTEEELQTLREDLEKDLIDNQGKPYAELVTPTGTGHLTNTRRVYRHITFPAHDEGKCPNPASIRAGDHTDCLLDQKRFKWHDLMRAKTADPRKFALTYQQTDEADTGNLIEEVWLTGGTDSQGILAPGCYNYQRRLDVIPAHLTNRKDKVHSVVTVDPSSQNYWSMQWWLYDRDLDRDYLIRVLRARLQSGDFLDYNEADHTYRGLAEKWQVESLQMGWPIGVWIVEGNAAQKYLYQHRWVHSWTRSHQTHIMPHTTGANKADPDLGVESLGPRYRLGLVDLPFFQADLKTRHAVSEFKQELVDWPDGATNDMVMGHWFLHFNRYKLPTSLTVAAHKKPFQHPFADSMPQSIREAQSRYPDRVRVKEGQHQPRKGIWRTT